MNEEKIVLNHLLNGKIKIYQFEQGFRVSQDAVLLAHFVDLNKIKSGAEILDVGAGNGGITLPTAYKIRNLKNVNITALDIQKKQLELLNTSFNENNFNTNLIIKNQDLGNLDGEIKEKLFDIVITNPPFYYGLQSSNQDVATAHHIDNGDLSLEKWIELSLKKLKANGWFYIIHQAQCMDKIVATLKNNSAGEIKILPIFSKVGDVVAKRVIISAKRVSKTPSTIFEPLYIYKDAEKNYTVPAEKIFSGNW